MLKSLRNGATTYGNNRIEQLDSIRGLAALSVLLSHLVLVKTEIFTSIMGTPLRMFLNGHAAVMLFFVLSGFVLSLPFLKNNKFDYLSYLTKRIFRIYLPYLVATTIAVICAVIFIQQKISGLSSWVNSSWMIVPNLSLMLEHLFLVGNIHSELYNNIIWSLVQELRISLIFPFLVIMVKKFDYRYCLLLCFVLSLFSGLNNIFHFQIANGLNSTYFHTLNYISIFILGSLLAKYKSNIGVLYNRLNTGTKWILFIICFFTYAYSNSVVPTVLGFHYFKDYLLIIEEYSQSLSAMWFIIIAIASEKVSRLLMVKPVAFLGKISYSLYLYHTIVILAFAHLFYGHMPMWLLLISSFVTSLIVATLSWKYIENPCNKHGRLLANKISDIRTGKVKVREELA